MAKNKAEKKSKRDRMPHYGRRAFSWSTYTAANGLQALMVAQLTFYLTESVMVTVGIASAIIAGARVFDGISDLIGGVIVDRTRTRWGNARPWTLMTIVMWVTVVLLFSVPDIGMTGKIIYVFIMYNLTDTVARTMLFASESVHMKKGFTDDEQLSVTGMSGLVGGILGMAGNIAIPTLIANFGQTDYGWTLIALVFAVPGVVMGMLKFFFLPEMDYAKVVEDKKLNKVPLKVVVKTLFHNKYIFIFEIALVFNRIMTSLGIANFYYTYVVGDLSMLSITSMFGLLSMVIMPLIPVLSRKMGVRNFISIFQIIGGGLMLLVFLAPTNIAMLSFGQAVLMLFGVPISMLMNIVAIQCMKYSEWKDGVRIDGVISSINGVAMKGGAALGALLTGILLGSAGYVGGMAQQPESALNMMLFLQIGAPSLCLLIGGIAMRFYTLDKKVPQIEADLKARYGELEPETEVDSTED